MQRAIEYNNKYLIIAKEVGDRAGQGEAYANLGLACHSLNEFQRAIEYNNKYLIIAKEVGDRAGQGEAYANLGFAYHSLKEFQRAIEYKNKSLPRKLVTGQGKENAMAVSAIFILFSANTNEQ